jgi:hypothetical protein
MKQLLCKEIRLTAHPTVFLFFCLSAMVLIPNYPYYTIFFYTSLGIFFTCLNGREFHDIPYTLSLPVRKRDAVTARFLFVLGAEIIQLLFTIGFSLLRTVLPLPDNQVGIEANPAFWGASLLLLGLFHLAFFGIYYRNPDHVGRAFAVSSIVMWVYILLAESCVHVFPFVKNQLDTYNPAFLKIQLLIFCGGLLAFCLLTLLAYRRAVHTFCALDL